MADANYFSLGIFPSEIWNRIFSNITDLKIIFSLQILSRQFKQLINYYIAKNVNKLYIQICEDDCQYLYVDAEICYAKKIDLKYSSMALEAICKSGLSISTLSFTITFMNNICDLLKLIIACCKNNILHLIINAYDHSDASYNSLWTVVSQLIALETFEYLGWIDEDTSSEQFIEALRDKPIKSIKLMHITNLTPNDVVNLVQTFTVPLKRLDFTYKSRLRGFCKKSLAYNIDPFIPLDEIINEALKRDQNTKLFCEIEELYSVCRDRAWPLIPKLFHSLKYFKNCKSTQRAYEQEYEQSTEYEQADYKAAEFVANFLEMHANDSKLRTLEATFLDSDFTLNKFSNKVFSKLQNFTAFDEDKQFSKFDNGRNIRVYQFRIGNAAVKLVHESEKLYF